MTSEPKRRVITLTGRPPVAILEEEWSVIAEAYGDGYQGADPALHNQAVDQGQVERWTVKVRRHEDGRAIISAVRNPNWFGGPDRRTGELVEQSTSSDIVAAIYRVVEDASIPRYIADECIADMPAEAL